MYTVYSLGFQRLSPSVLSCPAAGRPGEAQHLVEGLPVLGGHSQAPRVQVEVQIRTLGSAVPQTQSVPAVQA